jgi:hypothetical protein
MHITFATHSDFLPTLESALQVESHKLAAGSAVTVHLGKGGGYDGTVTVTLRPPLTHDNFESDWDGRDPTRFPARIKAAATALRNAGWLGVFRLTHKDGELSIERLASQGGEREPASRSTREINLAGIRVVASLLRNLGAEVQETGETGIHLFAQYQLDEDPVAIAVRANAGPKPAGGNGKPALDWWVSEETTADQVAFVDLFSGRVWLMPIDQLRTLAQQRSNGQFHLIMVVAESVRSKHARIRDRDFNEFLLGQAEGSPLRAASHPITSAAVDDVVAALEGEERLRLVRHRHRERALRGAKIQEVLGRSQDGRLRCEVPGCGFDFEARYGELGRGYAQVHHLRPLAVSGEPRETTLADLAVVCANCHVMIHLGGGSRLLNTLVRGS